MVSFLSYVLFLCFNPNTKILINPFFLASKIAVPSPYFFLVFYFLLFQILSQITNWLRCWTIKDEQLTSQVAYGNEFMFVTLGSIISVVLQVKKEELMKGFAQLYMEMFGMD